MEATGEQMTLFSQVASRDHANHTAQQVSDLEKKMTATSGQKCLEQFEKLNRSGLWAKTFAGLLIGMEGWYSMRCALTWKLKVTKSSRLYFLLQVSTPRTAETGYGLLPTPTAVQRDHPERVEALKATGAFTMMSRKNGENRPNLILDALNFYGLLPTPTASDKNWRQKSENWKGSDLISTVQEITGETGQLNPRFVGEMMGFPEDWTVLPFLSGETTV